MPAQDIQVLVNPKERDKSPWYTLKGEGNILTPEWGFTSADLKRFKYKNGYISRKPPIRKVKNHSESDRQGPFPGDVQ